MLLMKREELQELLKERSGPCVSLFMPTVKGSEETRQNPIRYRNLLRDAEKKLIAQGAKPQEAKDMLAPAMPMLEDNIFWQYQIGGLAVFISKGVRRAYTLPLNFTEMAVVTDHFCVRPLLPLFAEDGTFYVLALSQRSVKLYQCSRYNVSEADMKRIPKSLADLLELNPREKQLQYHSNTEGHGGPRQAGSFHGHAEDTDEAKENILVYFQNVNRGINAVLAGGNSPLVLAGVDYLTRIYEKANTYPRLAPGRIAGNPADLRPEQLKDKAWELVRPGFIAGQDAAVKQFRQLDGTPKASAHLKTILAAAIDGRVDMLMISSKAQRWGIFDLDSGVMDLHTKPEPSDHELLDICAARTLDHGGQVHVLDPERMPNQAPAAAVFRY